MTKNTHTDQGTEEESAKNTNSESSHSLCSFILHLCPLILAMDNNQGRTQQQSLLPMTNKPLIPVAELVFGLKRAVSWKMEKGREEKSSKFSPRRIENVRILGLITSKSTDASKSIFCLRWVRNMKDFTRR